MDEPRPYPGAPRWVKLSWMVAGVLTLLVAIVIHGGGGPNHHIPSGDGAATHGVHQQ